jgi:uncharacterized protein YjbI with pentapeptide repeats
LAEGNSKIGFKNAEKGKKTVETVEKLLDATNDSAKTASRAHIIFLFLIAYAALTIAASTPEQFVRASTITLPLIKLDIPITVFYLLLPWLLVVLHLNLLLHLYFVGRAFRVFNKYLVNLPERNKEEIFKNRLYSFPLIHIFMDSGHDKYMRFTFSLILYITVFFLPLTVLLSSQVNSQFFHNVVLANSHIIAVIMDLGMVGLIWPKIISQKGAAIWWWERGKRLFFLVLGVVSRLFPTKIQLKISHLLENTDDKKLSHGALILALLIPASLFLSIRVSLSSFTFFPLNIQGVLLTANELSADTLNALRHGNDQEQQEALKKALGLNLYDRDFRSAILINTFFPKASLNKVNLSRADLWQAYAYGAVFQETNLEGANLSYANLTRARFNHTQLNGAILHESMLTSAFLSDVDLKGALLKSSKLRQAYIQGSNLEEANLELADAEGSIIGGTLKGAHMHRAKLINAWITANLNGTYLKDAELQRSNMAGSSLIGAFMQNANLQGAQLQEVDLRGADLRGAKLQGTDLRGADLRGADLEGAAIGGANFEAALIDLADLRHIDRTPLSEADTETFNKIREQWEQYEVQFWSQINPDLASLAKANIIRTPQMAYAKDPKNMVFGPKDTLEKALTAEQDEPPCFIDELSGMLLFTECVKHDMIKGQQNKLIKYLVDLACQDKHIAKGIALQAYTDLPSGTISVSTPLDNNKYTDVSRVFLPTDPRSGLAKALVETKCEAVAALPERSMETLRDAADPQVMESLKSKSEKEHPKINTLFNLPMSD